MPSESVVKYGYSQSIATIQIFKAIDVGRNATRSWLKHPKFLSKILHMKKIMTYQMEATCSSETPKSVRNNKRGTMNEEISFVRNVGNCLQT